MTAKNTQSNLFKTPPVVFKAPKGQARESAARIKMAKASLQKALDDKLSKGRPTISPGGHDSDHL